jgi:hypothetical protein
VSGMSESELVTLVDISKGCGVYRANLTRYLNLRPDLFPGGSFMVPMNTGKGIQTKRAITKKDSIALIERLALSKNYASFVLPNVDRPFALELHLRTYISEVFTKNKIIYDIEFETGRSDCRCDFLIRNPEQFMLEIKRDKIKVMDIYQCYEYKRHLIGEYPVDIPIAIIGRSIDSLSLERAREYNIDVYIYKVVNKDPLVVIFTSLFGKHYNTLDNINSGVVL